MRDIKFRGKTKSNVWVYGYLVILEGNPAIYFQVGKGEVKKMDWVYVKPESVGQFTGLHDIYGKDIFEGDILRRPATNEWEKNSFVGYEVFWHDNDAANKHIGWQMNRHHFYGNICGTTDFVNCLPRYCSQLEIIGNIHDNPELMK